MRTRSAFTLLELILALSLVVVATALIGNLMHLYSRNFATRGEDIRRMQLARSILNMIAEDLRAVVIKQPYDASVLQQQLGGGGGATGGAATTSTAAASSTGASSTSGSTGSATMGAASGTASGVSTSTSGVSGSSSGAVADAAGTTSTEPGLYGTQFELILDVSRIPGRDVSNIVVGDITAPNLTDVPGDIKTVSYFVQSSTTMGVQDNMNTFNDGTETVLNAGLVRRQLDRAIIAYANEMGDTSRLMQTGDLVAPEVVALEFAYFDGTQWLYEWDSSTQSLPWLVQITLAIQSASGEAKAAMQPGISISSLTYDQQQEYGIQVFELVVAIPGAQLRAASTQATSGDNGMSSMGLP